MSTIHKVLKVCQMDRIQRHPWFTRKPAKIIGQVIAPPSPEQMEKPIGRLEDIDADILANLRTLWQGLNEDDLVKALISYGTCWQKVFYILLLKYRTKNMEDFNMDDDEPATPPTSSKPNIVRTKACLLSIAFSKDRKVSDDSQRQPTKPFSIATAAMSPPMKPASQQPSRPAPQPPARSADAASPRALPQAPSTPVTQRNSVRSQASEAEVPAITLQSATPNTSSGSNTVLSPQRPLSPPGSPTPSYHSAAPSSPKLPITIPETGDAVMQRFFHDIVDQLQHISNRPASVAGYSDGSSMFSSPEERERFDDADEADYAIISSPPMASPALSARSSVRAPSRQTRPPARPNSAFSAVSAPGVSRTNYYNQENSAPRGNRISAPPRQPLGLAIQAPGIDMFASASSSGSSKLKKPNRCEC